MGVGGGAEGYEEDVVGERGLVVVLKEEELGSVSEAASSSSSQESATGVSMEFGFEADFRGWGWRESFLREELSSGERDVSWRLYSAIMVKYLLILP